uniref:Uncharacterized protein n=1 Tax=Fundulus heteroclitus TaxID=8078 RepID=A0A3Q2Q7U9_FUNHE
MIIFYHSSLLNINCQTLRTFFNNQSQYLHNTVIQTWKTSQQKLMSTLASKKLDLGDDARCDSMGHSAKFGSYSLLELEKNKIISVQLVQSNEVQGSYHMELEGLKRCREAVDGFEIKAVVTDRHRQVGKWIRENWHVPHYFDCWHIYYSILYIKDWIKSLTYHLYWCAMSSEPGNGEAMKEKWLTVVAHMQNNHEKFTHGPMIKKWFTTGKYQYFFLNYSQIMWGPSGAHGRCFLVDITKMSSVGQTSAVVTFHSVVNHFAPKMYKLSFAGMKSRFVCLHFFSDFPCITMKILDLPNLIFPKYKKGGYEVKKVLVHSTYGKYKSLF